MREQCQSPNLATNARLATGRPRMTTTIESAGCTTIFADDEIRVEGREKVSGQAKYAADLFPAGDVVGCVRPQHGAACTARAN